MKSKELGHLSFKRAFDVVATLALLVVLFPLMLSVALVIRVKLGSPVFFCQIRPGRAGQLFQLIKFRTMREAGNTKESPLPDSERMTSLGSLLRSFSLDELPELWNVLRGDMSLVGPRPLLSEYLPLYSREQARRHEVRPGITGWAQVNGRNTLSWEERLAMDVWYVDNRSWWVDLKILARTVSKVFRREGINQDGCATMEKFRGSGKGAF